VLVRIGERGDTAIVLLGGLVKVHKRGARGEEVVLGICGPGDLLGEVAAARRVPVRAVAVWSALAVRCPGCP
jgi:CRP-like cAMP-binding protein